MSSVYRSKKQIENKQFQARYILRKMQQYRGKVFVFNGFDEENNVYPFQIDISSFLASSRSILQYALKEAKEKGMQRLYDNAIKSRPILTFFRNIRDTEIHENEIGFYTIIEMEGSISPNASPNAPPKEANIYTVLTRPIEDSIDASTGEFYYEFAEYEGEKDAFILCERYLDSIDEVVSELIQAGVIT